MKHDGIGRVIATAAIGAALLGCGGAAPRSPGSTMTPAEGPTPPPEQAAACDVGTAMGRALAEHRFDDAERAALQLIAQIPAGWTAVEETTGRVERAFFDMEEFLAFVAHEKASGGPTRAVVWTCPSYSKAWWTVAYVRVERQDPKGALAALDRALALEPDHPTILGEQSLVLVHSGQADAALAAVDAALAARPWMTAAQRARLLRGRGVVLVELGRLDEAEQSLKQSLELEPDSQVALMELLYIANQRQGGASAPVTIIPTP
jgi:tetratricopeptide (TPR) repeat protein